MLSVCDDRKRRPLVTYCRYTFRRPRCALTIRTRPWMGLRRCRCTVCVCVCVTLRGTIVLPSVVVATDKFVRNNPLQKNLGFCCWDLPSSSHGRDDRLFVLAQLRVWDPVSIQYQEFLVSSTVDPFVLLGAEKGNKNETKTFITTSSSVANR